MITAQAAVDDLYRIAVEEEKATSTARLEVLADFCVQEINRRGLKCVEKEATIPGGGRAKKWDVAWCYDGKYRLGVSLKSLLKTSVVLYPIGSTIRSAKSQMLNSARRRS